MTRLLKVMVVVGLAFILAGELQARGTSHARPAPRPAPRVSHNATPHRAAVPRATNHNVKPGNTNHNSSANHNANQKSLNHNSNANHNANQNKKSGEAGKNTNGAKKNDGGKDNSARNQGRGGRGGNGGFDGGFDGGFGGGFDGGLDGYDGSTGPIVMEMPVVPDPEPRVMPGVIGSWVGSENLQNFGRLEFRFGPNGQVTMLDAAGVTAGNYSVNGNAMTVTFNNGQCVYNGIIDGNTLSGMGQTSQTSWKFSVSR